MNRASVFEWHKRFKGGMESVRDNERCGRSKEDRTPESCPEDLPEAMNDREKWRERIRDIRASGTT